MADKSPAGGAGSARLRSYKVVFFHGMYRGFGPFTYLQGRYFPTVMYRVAPPYKSGRHGTSMAPRQPVGFVSVVGATLESWSSPTANQIFQAPTPRPSPQRASHALIALALVAPRGESPAAPPLQYTAEGCRGCTHLWRRSSPVPYSTPLPPLLNDKYEVRERPRSLPLVLDNIITAICGQ